MKRIILHWTAGTNYPTNFDKQFYHYLIDKDGRVYNGKYKPRDNEDCSDGYYAQHTGGGNTGSIGVALCGMFSFVDSNNLGPYPLTRVQCEKAFSLIADLCKEYNIPITANTVLTHYEFGKKHPKSTSFGKIDIIYMPAYPSYDRFTLGNFIRSKVRWYYYR